MALKFKLNKTEYDDLDEGVQALYHKDGKNYVLSVDGAVDKSRLAEFRTSNQTLQQQLDDFEKKYGDLDYEEIKELIKTKGELDEKKLIKEGDLDTLFEKRMKKIVDPLNLKIDGLTASGKLATENLSRLTIDNRVVKNGAKLGAHETALDDLCARARNVFSVGKDGKPEALDEDGDPLMTEGGKKLDIDSWLGIQKATEAPHCFRSTKGANEQGELKPGQKPPEGERSSHQKISDGLKARGMNQ